MRNFCSNRTLTPINPLEKETSFCVFFCSLSLCSCLVREEEEKNESLKKSLSLFCSSVCLLGLFIYKVKMAVQAQQQQHSENLGISFCGSSSQEWMMENNNACGGGGFDQPLYLSLQQQQLFQQQQQQMMLQNQQRNFSNQNMGFDYCGQQLVSTSNNNNHDSSLHSSMAFTQSLLSQVEKQQRQEIDRFVALQVNNNQSC